MSFRLPNTSQRSVVIGRTGSGKTVLGAWLLSLAPFDKMPYIIMDYKGEEIFRNADRIKEIGLKKIPTEPGLYVVRPMPKQDEDVENFLWKVWEQEHVGLYFDEGYALPKGSASLQAIYTQGRSKRIPCITCTQRPTWLSKFTFTEADFFSIFQLNNKDDRKTVQDYIPKDDMNVEDRLQTYYSHWYDVGNASGFLLKPVPHPDKITEILQDRLKPETEKRFL